MPNGRNPESAHYVYKLELFAALRTALEAELSQHAQLAVCGDVNVAPTDDDVWDPKVFVNSTHVTPPERQALADLRALGLTDVVPKPILASRLMDALSAALAERRKALRAEAARTESAKVRLSA